MATNRRAFLLSSAAAAGGLALGFAVPGRAAFARRTAEAADLNAFVRIGSDGTITLQVPCSEMGQGIHTGLAQVLADELDAEWTQIRVEVPQPAAVYDNPAFGMMFTVGSQSMRQYFEPLRKAGATARALLTAAAAQRWGVAPEACRTRQSRVFGPAGQTATYGNLAGAAAQMTPPAEPPLKARSEWTLIGREQARIETAGKVGGTAVFGADVALPGLLSAAVRQCPLRGGTLRAVRNEAAVSARPGVRAIVPLHPDAVGVVADHQWQALSAAEALEIDWDESAVVRPSAAAVDQSFVRAIDATTDVGIAENEGDVEAHLAGADHVLQADYDVPFLAHAPMEPPACTVRVDAAGCEIWVPTQGQSIARFAAARAAAMDPDRVRVHTTLLGGGFGRKSQPDFIVHAVRMAMTDAVRGRPLRLTWSREEDVQHDFYRPRTRHRLKSALAADDLPAAWSHRIAAPSIALSATPMQLDDNVDRIVVEGAVRLPYALDHRRVEYVRCEVGMRVGFWRSVGWSANVFAIESFVDELAHAAGRDPLDYRRALLTGKSRHLAVLDRVAQAADWSKPRAADRYHGVAFAEEEETLCAQVAEISVGQQGRIAVHRIVCALDCGTIVNPALVREQVVGATLFGLSAALYEAITVDQGRVQQSNFDGYRLLRMSEAPEVEVHLVDSTAPPTGVGEIATSPIGAAVCNAVFAATGERVRTLPLATGYRRSS